MGNCGSNLNCSSPRTDASGDIPHFEVDPDIVGLGVLSAFLVTALLTCGAIVVGYLTDSLPDDRLNEVDAAVTELWQESIISTRLIPFMLRLRDNFLWLLQQCHLTKVPSSPHRTLTKERRTQALKKFILTLSDQQLVTGLAILIAAIQNRCRMSEYEFTVVASLAWFSSTTHLATLRVLHEYFLRNPIVRNWRIFGMLSMLGLLLFALVIKDGYEVRSAQLSLQCMIDQVSDVGVRPIAMFNLISILIFLVWTYFQRILSLYVPSDELQSPSRWCGQRAVQLLLWSKVRSLGWQQKDFNRLFDMVVNEEHERSRVKSLGILRNGFPSRNGSKILRSIRTNLHRLQLVFNFYSSSFLSRIAYVFFGVSYGISQLVVYRWTYAPQIANDPNRMDFGQIVSLILLALPMLAAAEIYYESQDSPDNTTDTSSRRISHSSHNSTQNDKSSMPILNDPVHLNSGRHPVDSYFEDNDSLNELSKNTLNEVSQTEGFNLRRKESLHDESIPPNSRTNDNPFRDRRVMNVLLVVFIYSLLVYIMVGIFLNIQYAFSAGLVGFAFIFRIVPIFLEFLKYVGPIRKEMKRMIDADTRAKHQPMSSSVPPKPNDNSAMQFSATRPGHHQNNYGSNSFLANNEAHRNHYIHGAMSPLRAETSEAIDVTNNIVDEIIRPEDDRRTCPPLNRRDTEADMAVIPPRSDASADRTG